MISSFIFVFSFVIYCVIGLLLTKELMDEGAIKRNEILEKILVVLFWLPLLIIAAIFDISVRAFNIIKIVFWDK